MIKAALQWLKDQTPDPVVTVEGREYSTLSLSPVKNPMPEPLKFHTLTGIVDYIAAQKDAVCDMQGEQIFLHVVSHNEVRLLTEIQGAFEQRKNFMVAQPPESRIYPFGHWLDAETFNIELQAKFVQDDSTKSLLAFIASIQEGEVRTSRDDGVSQEVTTKAGVTLLQQAKVPNPVTLRPYRTFIEVIQPAISCVFRVRKGPELSLHEADGGGWRLFAISAIRDYLRDAMNTLGQKIPVIA